MDTIKYKGITSSLNRWQSLPEKSRRSKSAALHKEQNKKKYESRYQVESGYSTDMLQGTNRCKTYSAERHHMAMSFFLTGDATHTAMRRSSSDSDSVGAGVVSGDMSRGLPWSGLPCSGLDCIMLSPSLATLATELRSVWEFVLFIRRIFARVMLRNLSLRSTAVRFLWKLYELRIFFQFPTPYILTPSKSMDSSSDVKRV